MYSDREIVGQTSAIGDLQADEYYLIGSGKLVGFFSYCAASAEAF